MSFVITVYVPEGIVMASDSRQSITLEGKTPEGKPLPKIETVSSDYVYKTFLLEKQKVGINTFGASILEKVTVESYIKRFAEEALTETDDVSSVPGKLINFFSERFPKVDLAFHVAGFRKKNKISIPYVFHCHVARKEIARQNVKPSTEEIVYGATWGGQGDIIAGILMPTQKGVEKAQVPKFSVIWDAMTLQDAIDFAIYGVRTTIDTMRFQARPKNVGGPIDALLLTPEEQRWIQRKGLHGEKPQINKSFI